MKAPAESWINGRAGHLLDCRDRGLQYGDGLFETMRVRRRAIRLLDFHLERLAEGCRRLAIEAPDTTRLRRELNRVAARWPDAVLKLIVTRGIGPRGYRPSKPARGTRVLSVQALSPAAIRAVEAVQVRLCASRLGVNRRLAGLKTLNRLESVLARAEWTDGRVWEGLLRDTDENIVCGTMSNVFIRHGSVLTTPLLDRCGIAGVMRRWVLSQARALGLRVTIDRVRLPDLARASEVFLTNAVVGMVPVAVIRHGQVRLRFAEQTAAHALRARLEVL
jgi:4-amino-4-deoxychorismate lyase